MITEDQARTLFQGDPVATLDARAVLATGRRARRRRTVAVAALAGASAVAVAAVALATDSTSRPPDVVAQPSDSPAPATSAASPTGPRFVAGQIGNAVVIGSYTQDGRRHDVYAYFAPASAPRGQTPPPGGTMVCTVAMGPADERTDFGCHGPAIERGTHVGAAAGNPGATENGAASTFGPLGRGYSFTVVSTRVATGGVYDETGAFHEGRVLGIGDPTLPARILVAEIGNHWFRGVVVRDANGTVLQKDGPWTTGPS